MVGGVVVHRHHHGDHRTGRERASDPNATRFGGAVDRSVAKPLNSPKRLATGAGSGAPSEVGVDAPVVVEFYHADERRPEVVDGVVVDAAREVKEADRVVCLQ